MKLLLSITAAVLAAALSAPLAFAQPASKKSIAEQTPAETWEELKAYTLEKKKNAVAFGRKLVNSADRDIKHLESEGSKASGEAKEEYRKELRERDKKMDERIGALVSAIGAYIARDAGGEKRDGGQ